MSLIELRKVILLSASFLILIIGCKKDGALSPAFEENSSSSFFSDTTRLIAKTELGGRILADRASTGLIGAYRDSVFGKSSATLYLQPLLPTNFLVLKEQTETIFTDSIVLSLSYNGYYGDTSIATTFDVFRLSEELDIQVNYYSDTSINTTGGVLGSKTFKPRINTNLKVNTPNILGGVDTTLVNPQLRIRLDKSLGDEIVSKSGQNELSTNEEFIKFFKGIRISPAASLNPSNNESSVLYIATTSSDTKISLYYKTINPQGDTTRKIVSFPVNSSSVRFNAFSHDFSEGDLINTLNRSGNDSLFSYTQSMGGVRTKIAFPNIVDQFDNQSVIINKAQLTIPAIGGSYLQGNHPAALIVATLSPNGDLDFIPDFFEGDAFFGGLYNAVDRSYTFTITRYIQRILNEGNRNNELVLLVSGSAVNADRLVLGAPGNERKIKLNLFYSKTEK